MAVYKIPQDVEAEDKLIGPFTVKQSIFLFVAAFFGTAGYFMARISPFFLFLVGPPFLIFFFLGVYRPKDQPIEVYLMARLRFLFKPRKRIWDASGLHEEHVIVEKGVPVAGPRSATLANEQVNSRLDRLSSLMDTRGWSARGAQETTPGTVTPGFQKSGRLASGQPARIATEVYAEDDILDPLNNQASNTLMQLNRAAQIERRREIIAQMRSPEYQQSVADQQAYTSPTPASSYQNTPQQPQAAPQSTVNEAPDPAIMNLLDNNDLTVSGIARQADTQRPS